MSKQPPSGGNNDSSTLGRAAEPAVLLQNAFSGPSKDKQPPITTLYHPSVFRYTCKGRLTLDSRNGGKSKLSAGVCYGIQSKLEHVDHWRLTTRDEAIQIFQSKMMMLDNGEEGYGDGNGNGIPKKKKESPSLSPPSPPTIAPPVDGGDPAAAAHAMQAVYVSNVLVYPPTVPDGDDENDNKDKNKHKKKRAPTLPSTLPQEESWRCYGSTEVDLLVLRPQHSKEECIAAVAPYCAPGSTVRDISTPTLGKERTTTVRLGILEIIYQSVVGAEEDEDDEVVGSRSNHKGDTSTTAAPSSSGDEDSNNDIRSSSKKGNTDKQRDKKESAISSSMPGRIYQSGTNILKHMKLNGQILLESFQDEYPSRTYDAGQRIVAEFGKTADRTLGLMKKVATFLVKGDWDDGTGDGGSGSGSGPPKPRG